MATPSFGENLKQERERRNTSIEEIAEKTKIALRFLKALEKDEFDELPGRAFGKFYIRAYAEVLDFDPEPLIVQYDREQADADGAPAETAPSEPPRLRRVEAEIARWREARLADQRSSTDVPSDGEPEDLEPTTDIETREDSRDAMADEGEAHHDDGDVSGTVLLPEFDRERSVGGARYDEAAALASILGARETTPTSSRRRRRILVSVLGVALLIVLGWAIVSLREPVDGVGEVQRSTPDEDALVSGPAESNGPGIDETTEETATSEPVPASPRDPVRTAEPDRSGLTVSEFGVGRRIVDRRLEGHGQRFEEGSVVWFQTRVVGGRRGETVRHVWMRDGRAVQTVDLELGGSHWRTHSRKTLWGTGSWSVEARDTSGRVLARSDFVCIPAD